MNKKHKHKLLISSCLIGENVKYNGGNNLICNIHNLKNNFELFALCPETLGGMTIPREPCEIQNTNPLIIQNKTGQDMTKYFLKGAKRVLAFVQKHNIKYALLKSNSPSCGNKKVYNGTFNKILINLQGVTSKILQKNNIIVYNEKEIGKLYDIFI